eukprot:TRINITY_DN68836_c0_g1_i1.p1 TRINITY_DN68836_c0_g1~~TRINITY_DN68836_c0_g1_i1.p1  ORF type:complete len:308 (+),score=42.09 TRINITY_DN68836_c0_g1_i1:193-1116(+)
MENVVGDKIGHDGCPDVAVLGRSAIGDQNGEFKYFPVVFEFAKAQGCEHALQQKQNINRVRNVSCASVLVCVLLGVITAVIGLRDRSVSMAGLSGEILLTSVVSAANSRTLRKRWVPEYVDADRVHLMRAIRDAWRDRAKAIGIGIGFLLLGSLLVTACAWQIAYKHIGTPDNVATESEGARFEKHVAFVCFLVFATFASIKRHLAELQECALLREDAALTFFGAVLALIACLGGFLEDFLEHSVKDQHWHTVSEIVAFGIIEPLVSTLLALLIFASGICILIHKASPSDFERNAVERLSMCGKITI